MKLRCQVDGTPRELEVRADEMLISVLRRDLGLLSVRETCSIGVCGACTVLLDGEPVSACILLAPLAEGRAIETVEGLGGEHPLQRAFASVQAHQCGWCTPGMILTAKALLAENPHPSEEQIITAMSGNLCRCGCYAKIVEAVQMAAS